MFNIRYICHTLLGGGKVRWEGVVGFFFRSESIQVLCLLTRLLMWPSGLNLSCHNSVPLFGRMEVYVLTKPEKAIICEVMCDGIEKRNEEICVLKTYAFDTYE